MSARYFGPSWAANTAMLVMIGVLSIATPTVVPTQGPSLSNQRFEVTPEAAHPRVGDLVSLRFRVRLDERDLLYDTVPRPVADLPEGVRIVSVQKLQRGADRIYTGHAQVAFYRPGRQGVPLFGLPFMRAVKGVTRAVLTSDSAFVEIEPVAPAGNPTLRDIKEIERQPGPDPRVVAGLLGAAVVAVVGALLGRRRRAPLPISLEAAVRLSGPLGPYAKALDRLSQIEAERWSARGEVERHYEAVTDVIREYLEKAHGIPALERTTSELRWALPSTLAEAGLGERCNTLLGEADLVKFARRRPDEMDAAALLVAARDLLGAWHQREGRIEEQADAIR
jgi:hypothetical protein